MNWFITMYSHAGAWEQGIPDGDIPEQDNIPTTIHFIFPIKKARTSLAFFIQH